MGNEEDRKKDAEVDDEAQAGVSPATTVLWPSAGAVPDLSNVLPANVSQPNYFDASTATVLAGAEASTLFDTGKGLTLFDDASKNLLLLGDPSKNPLFFGDVSKRHTLFEESALTNPLNVFPANVLQPNYFDASTATVLAGAEASTLFDTGKGLTLFDDASKNLLLLGDPSKNPLLLGDASKRHTLFEESVLTNPLSANVFRLPATGEVAALTTLLPPDSSDKILGSAFDTARLLTAASMIHTPWILDANPTQSLTALAHLDTLGEALRLLNPYEAKLTDHLRAELGDWRQPIDWSKTNLLDPLARSALYADHGLNQDLVHFPRAAFVESIGAAQLDADTTNDDALSEEELAYSRTTKAYSRLLHFEISVRAFICRHMLAIFGEKWWKQQVPGDVYEQWRRKHQEAVDKGSDANCPLIDYADFSDYLKIIARSDNWRQAFKPIFRSRESVTESFQRLYPIRICTMHARLISSEDELYLLAETTRLLKAMD